MRRLLLTCCVVALSGCGLIDALSGHRPTDEAQGDARAEGATPGLVATPGGVSKGTSHELFLRPTSASTSAPTLEGDRHELRAFDARPQGGDAR